MEYKTKSGAVITDETLERLGDACEKGQYPGNSGKTAMAERLKNWHGQPYELTDEDRAWQDME
jgi:hypothetical protein